MFLFAINRLYIGKSRKESGNMQITKTLVNGITWPTTGTLFNVDCLQLIILLMPSTQLQDVLLGIVRIYFLFLDHLLISEQKTAVPVNAMIK